MRSLKAIIGVGDDALAHLTGFLLIFLILASGFLAARHRVLGERSPDWARTLVAAAFALHLVILPLLLVFPSLTQLFL